MTTVDTGIARKVTVIKHTHGSANLHVHDTDMDMEIYTHLDKGDAEKVGLALLGENENATVVTDLPEVKVDTEGWLNSGSNGAWLTTKPERVLKNAKELLAIHAHLVKRNAEQEAAKAAEAEKEAQRNKRREELIKEFRSCGWSSLTRPAREAYDRIIDLEEAAKVS